MSEASEEDEIDMAMFDDKPKEQEETENKSVKAYKGIKDTHDYGQSDNEE